MTFTDEDEQRIARLETMILAIAQGTVTSRCSVLYLARSQRIGGSRAGVVGAAVALTGAAIGGAALALHAGGFADRLRASAGHVATSIQAVPALVGPAPRPAVVKDAQTATRPRPASPRHRVRPHREPRTGPAIVGADRVGEANSAGQALRDAYADDARRTREVNEAALDDLRRR